MKIWRRKKGKQKRALELGDPTEKHMQTGESEPNGPPAAFCRFENFVFYHLQKNHQKDVNRFPFNFI
jgi:hypothetical protein